MKVIITGATGGLGHNCVDYFKEKKWEIIACGRNKEIGTTLGVDFRSFDLSDDEQTNNNFESADLVIHCAAKSSPWGSYQEFYQSNVCATKNVLKAMHLYNIPKIIHISTPSLYFDFAHQMNCLEENLPQKFVNNYALTKYEAELEILKSDVESVILRPRGIFGEYDQVLVPRIEKIANKGALPLVKGREVIVDITYVGNVVHAIFLASTKKVPKHSIMNITNGSPREIQKVFSLMGLAIGLDIKFKKVPFFILKYVATFLERLSKMKLIGEPLVTKYGVGLIAFSQTLDISKARDLLGYEPLFTIEEGVERYAKWRNKNI